MQMSPGEKEKQIDRSAEGVERRGPRKGAAPEPLAKERTQHIGSSIAAQVKQTKRGSLRPPRTPPAHFRSASLQLKMLVFATRSDSFTVCLSKGYLRKLPNISLEMV